MEADSRWRIRRPRQRRNDSLFYRLTVILTFFLLCNVEPSCAASASSSSSSYYHILGVEKTATPQQIKRAYRKAALANHPDKPGGDEEKFKKISKAYEVLSDEESRSRYDQFGEAGVDNPQFQQAQQGGGFPSGFFGGSSNGGGPGSFQFHSSGDDGGIGIDLEDLLRQAMGGNGAFMGAGPGGRNSFFGGMPQQGGRPFQKPRKAKVYERPLLCSLEELATGATKKVKVTFRKFGSHVLTVKLKPGWKAGTKIKFAATSSHPNFPAVTLVVEERRHTHFTRRGDDLIFRQPTGTAAGAEPIKLEIPLLDGSMWIRKVPPSLWRPGQSMTIPDHGMPIKGGPAKGNLVVEFV